MELVQDRAPSSFRLSEVLAALSHALDLTEGQPVGHAVRTCMLGLRIADQLGLSDDDRNALFYALLLKDAGCSSSSARMSQLFGVDDLLLKQEGKMVDWSRPADVLRFVSRHSSGGGSPLRKVVRVGSVAKSLKSEGQAIVETRCERGANVVRGLDLPEAAAVAVRELDEHWDGSGQPYGLHGDAISIVGRVGCIAQNAELFLAAGGRDAMREMIGARRDRWFDPEIADALLQIPGDDPVWTALRGAQTDHLLSLLAPADIELGSDDAKLDQIAEAFASIVDAKSPYTARHSAGVALHAGVIGRELGFGPALMRDLRRGGLLHDIGKLGISNTILDKPGKLDDAEFARIKLHPVFTEQILSRVPAFAPIATASSAHHERIDGGGYPNGTGGASLSSYTRVLAVADVFEALTADRPYRDGMAVDEALAIMQRGAGTHLCIDTLHALERGLRASESLAA
ncbi:MAG TPA: HD domain-containing phosphohydrolase [Gaiellales bacterium]|jgi:HD-GYP domain-containing protein (c-di-GMP phosphodiesterase class II)